jgi:hypothetical protein
MGHYSNECPQPDKRSTGVQLLECDDASASDVDPKDYAFYFATAAVRHVNQNWIVLDNESTVSIVSNARFLTNVLRMLISSATYPVLEKFGTTNGRLQTYCP